MNPTFFRHPHQSFTVYQIPALRDNYIYLIANPASHQALVIDPADADTVIAVCEQHGLTPTAILNTHHHWDHTDGNAGLVAHYGLAVIAPGSQTPHTTCAPAANMHHIGLNIRTLTIPGHTLDHVAYLVGDALFCGDTLFGCGCGRIFEGTAVQMWQSLQQLTQLPDETRVYCAHEYTLANIRFAHKIEPNNPALEMRWQEDKAARKRHLPTIPSTIGKERATNPFLRPLDPHFCSDYAEQHKISADPQAIFAHLRLSKDQSS